MSSERHTQPDSPAPAPKIDDGGPAFPSEGEGHGNPRYHTPGMSLRDRFAGQALQSIIVIGFADARDAAASREHAATRGITPFAAAAHMAYEFADAMLAARKGGVA